MTLGLRFTAASSTMLVILQVVLHRFYPQRIENFTKKIYCSSKMPQVKFGAQFKTMYVTRKARNPIAVLHHEGSAPQRPKL